MKKGRVMQRSPRADALKILSAAPAGLEGGAVQIIVLVEAASLPDDYQLLMRMHGKFVSLEICETRRSAEGKISILAK
eukprot:scaffold10486_cov21-Prasinocladus_malaysianus.AAC.1